MAGTDTLTRARDVTRTRLDRPAVVAAIAVLVLFGSRRSLRPYAALLVVPLALIVGHRLVSL